MPIVLCVCFLNPWHVKFYEYILFCVSIRSSVCASVTKFFLNLFFSSFVKFCIVTETKKHKKATEADFPEKFLFTLKSGKKAPNVVFLLLLPSCHYFLLVVALNERHCKTLEKKSGSEVKTLMFLPSQIAGFFDHQYLWK